MTKKTLGLALGLTFCSPSLAIAQTTSSEDPGVTEIEEVVVTGIRRDPRRDSISSRIVVSQDELTRFGDTSLADAMKRLPGITIGGAEAGQPGGISMRGMGEGYTQILINGQKAPAGFSLDSLTPDMVAQIEILRSPTADVRSEGSAGSINIVLARGADTDTKAAGLTWETTNGRDTLNASWRSARQSDDIDRALAINLRRRPVRAEETELWQAQGPSVPGDALRTRDLDIEAVRTTLTVTPTLQAELTGNDRLGATGIIDITRLDRSGKEEWQTFIGSPLARSALRQQARIDQIRLNLGLDWTRTFQSGAVLTSKASAATRSEAYSFDEQGFDVDGAQSLDDRTRARTRAFELTMSSKYAFAKRGAHTIEIGWEAMLEHRKDRRVQELAPIGPSLGQFDEQTLDVEIHRVALYAQDEIAIDAALSVYFGMRWEGVETNSASADFQDVSLSESLLAPSFNTVWKLPGASRRQIRLGVNRTFKLPAMSSLMPRLYTASNNGPLTPDERGNPELRPETATGLDLAFEYYAAKGAQLSFGTFVRQIEATVRTETFFDNGRWVASPLNGGTTIAWGLEADGQIEIAKLRPAAPNITLRFNATYANSSVSDVAGPDNRLPNQIPFSATVGADYAVNPRWAVGASYGYRSSSTIQITPHNANRCRPPRTWKPTHGGS